MWKRPKGKFKKGQRLVGKLSRAAVVELYRRGFSAQQIAERDGTSKNSVLHVLKVVGEQRRPGGAPAKHRASEIAVKFGVAPQTYLRFLVIKKLGAKCAGCGETDPRILAVNHLNGKQHKLSMREMARILTGIINDVDVRCANCNVLYEYERGAFKNHTKLLKYLF